MKNLIGIVLLSVLVACGSSQGEETKTGPAAGGAEGMTIAFYIKDSVTTRLNYYKDELKRLQTKYSEYEKKMIKLQNEAQMKFENFQRQQAAGLLAPSAAEKKQREIEDLQMKMQVLQQTEGMEIEQEQFKATETVYEKLGVYGKEYCEKNGYDILLGKEKTGELIYAAESANVTMDFIDFMNKREKESNQEEAKEE